MQHVIDTNTTETIYLLHKLAPDMVKRGHGKKLITGSIAGFLPGTFQAVYNGSKAFVDSFSAALRNELKDTGVTVTCLMPGVTDTDFLPTPICLIQKQALMSAKPTRPTSLKLDLKRW